MEDTTIHLGHSVGEKRDSNSSIRKQRIQHEIDRQDKQFDTEYSSCCAKSGKTDKRLLDYGAKMTLSLLVLGFSFYQIIVNNDKCDPNAPIYTSFITMIVGAWINTKLEKK